jgi:hypothetical protein
MDELMHTLERVSAKKTQLDAARPGKKLVSLTEACVLTV